MNAPLSSRVFPGIKLCTALAVLTFLLNGCFLWDTGNQPSPAVSAVKPGVISSKRIRARKESKTILCLIAEQGKPFSEYDEESGNWLGAEPEMVRAIAAKLKMNVVFISVPEAALASALRNGRGDLAIGQLTTSRIAAYHQAAVCPYAPVQDEHYALMIRSDEADWKNDLEKAAAGIDGAALLKANGKDLKPIAVEVAEKENSDEVISISVDLNKKNDQKAPEKK